MRRWRPTRRSRGSFASAGLLALASGGFVPLASHAASPAEHSSSPSTAGIALTVGDPTKVAAPVDARQLLAAFSTVTGLEAEFNEEKKLALLKAPLRTSGRLYYRRPGQLARQVDAPEKSLIRVKSGVVTIIDKDGTRRIDLRSRPAVASFVESFSDVFGGKYAELAKHYSIKYTKAKDNSWRLTLAPSAAPLNQLVRRIEMRGQGLLVVELSIDETNGDRTVTRLSKANAERKFSPEEIARLFGS